MDIVLPLSHSLEDVFINRAQELETLRDWCLKPGSTVSLVGPAGIGKTALLYMFVRRFSNLFPGGVVHLSFKDFADSNLKQNLNVHSTSDQQLLIIDDADAIPKRAVIDIINTTENSPNTSLIVAGRRVPITNRQLSKTIQLSGLSMAALVQARLRLFPEAPELDKVLRFIDGNPLLLSILSKNPRQALAFANKLFSSGHEPFQVSQPATQVTVSQTSPNIDIISILIAIVLFLLSQISSNKSEERILDKIQNLHQTVYEMTAEQRSASFANPHVVKEFLKLREEPTIRPDNVITILLPGQMVDLIEVSSGWAKVDLLETKQNKKVVGWVSSKYLIPVKNAPNQGSSRTLANARAA